MYPDDHGICILPIVSTMKMVVVSSHWLRNTTEVPCFDIVVVATALMMMTMISVAAVVHGMLL